VDGLPIIELLRRCFMSSLVALPAMSVAGFLVLLPRILMIVSVVLMIGCPISALLFPKRKGDPIFRHDCL
jgi:hypothetical protein